MLYTCGCDQRVIDIPLKKFLTCRDEELEEYCAGNNGCQISNPWYNSFAESKGVILTPEQVEELNDQEYEEDDNPVNADLNVEEDYWES